MRSLFREHGLLLFVLAAVQRCLASVLDPVSAMIPAVLMALFFRIRTKRNLLYALLLLTIVSLPHVNTDPPAAGEYTVIRVRRSYSVLYADHRKLLVYHTEPLLCDAVYRFDGECEQLRAQAGFYRFDFRRHCRQEGITYCCDSSHIELVREKRTVLRRIQKRISVLPEDVQEVLQRVLLNIRPSEEDSILAEYGFSLSGLLSLAELGLKRFLTKKQRKHVMAVMTAWLLYVYYFPLILVQRLVYYGLGMVIQENRECTAPGLCLMLCLYPEAVFRIGFWIPAVLRICTLTGRSSVSDRLLYLSVVSLILNGRISPLVSMLFGTVRLLSGFLYMNGLCTLFLPHLFAWILNMAAGISALPKWLTLHGSVFGGGLPVFLILYAGLGKHKKSSVLRMTLLVVFLYTGLFHPFAEVTFINVGQGDSILIREPLNRMNCMIDTGKPEQEESIRAMLDAKGIRRIDTLFITHSDSDHAGNTEMICSEYAVNHLVTEHFSEMRPGRIQFHDLSRIKTEDENQSSLIHYFRAGHLYFLCMGDADASVEETLIQEYGELPCDILKLSHHGSNTGSCGTFLDAVKPMTAIISSGAYSIYHHPSPDVTQRLAERHIPYFDTKEEGDITILFLPGMDLMITSKGKIVFLYAGLLKGGWNTSG